LNKEEKKIILFLVWALVIYLAWYFLFEFWILPHTQIHHYFTLASTVPATGILNVLDILPVYWTIDPLKQNVIIHHMSNGMRVVNVGHGCNALTLMVLFSGFILALPGKLWQKAVFIPAGNFAIFILNIFRIVGLTWTWYFHGTWTDFNHKYLFTALMYAAILGFWIVWILWTRKTGPQKLRAVSEDKS
jgi:exosortase family protein XrtF